jgi:hypothetical protein
VRDGERPVDRAPRAERDRARDQPPRPRAGRPRPQRRRAREHARGPRRRRQREPGEGDPGAAPRGPRRDRDRRRDRHAVAGAAVDRGQHARAARRIDRLRRVGERHVGQRGARARDHDRGGEHARRRREPGHRHAGRGEQPAGDRGPPRPGPRGEAAGQRGGGEVAGVRARPDQPEQRRPEPEATPDVRQQEPVAVPGHAERHADEPDPGRRKADGRHDSRPIEAVARRTGVMTRCGRAVIRCVGGGSPARSCTPRGRTAGRCAARSRGRSPARP